MSNPIILEVKEKNSTGVSGVNGVFETILTKPITIEDGDEVMLKSVFIDNQETSEQKVIIEEDITLELSYGHYIRNVDLGSSKVFRNLAFKYDESGDNMFSYTATDGSNVATQNPPHEDTTHGYNNTVIDGQTFNVKTIPLDFRAYVPCLFNDQHNTNGTGVLKSITLERFITANMPNFEVGEQTVLLTVNYFNASGTKKTINLTDSFTGYVKSSSPYLYVKTISLSKDIKVGAGFEVSVDMTFDYHGNGQVSTKPLPLDKPEKDWNNAIGVTVQSTSAESSFQPLIFTTQVSLKKGSYGPNDICDIINRAMTSYGDISGSGDLIEFDTNLLGTTKQDATGIKYIREDGALLFEMKDTNPQYFRGSNQFALNYDEITNRFQFQFIHFPMYDINGNLINQITETIGMLDLSDRSNTPTTRSCGSTSGIYFENLTATKTSDGTPFDFWASKLGFTQTNLFVNPTQIFGSNNSFNTQLYPTFDLIPGVNITQARNDVDNLVLKGNTYESFKGPNVIQFSEVGKKPIQSSEQSALPIDAEVSVFRDIVDEGYYQVEVSCGINNTFVNSKEIKSKISSIVSRYYSQNSYTSDDGAGSISYTHRGTPFNLSSFRVRILDSNGDVASNIGDDNTLFIEVVKSTNTNK
mgnify:CR=1 FL=1